MKAAVLSENQVVQILNIPVPVQANRNDVIADVFFVGICKTDYALAQSVNTTGIVLGHEVVCRLPNESGWFALNNEITCGQCQYCKAGLKSHCVHLLELGVNRNGGYAEHLGAPRSCFQPFNFGNPLSGVLIEPLSCAIHGATRLLNIMHALSLEGADVLLIGGGVSGALIAFLMTTSERFTGRVQLYDISSEHLAWTAFLKIERIDSSRPYSCPVVVECSGTQDGLSTAFKCVRNAGLVFSYGVPPIGESLPVSTHTFFSREMTFATSMAGTTIDTMAEAIDCIANNETFFEQLVGRVISLEQLPEELRCWRPNPGTRTVVAINNTVSP